MTLQKVADAAEPQEATVPVPEPGAERASVYVPRILQQHLVDDPAGRCWTGAGSAALADISGFTQLAEVFSSRTECARTSRKSPPDQIAINNI